MEELEPYSTTVSIIEGGMTIQGFRSFSRGKPELERYLYFGKAQDALEDTAAGVLLAHREDTIIVKNADLPEILNVIIQIFEKYQQWDESLQTAGSQPEQFQTTLDVAHDLLQCPMYFGNISMHLYAVSQQYSKEQVFEEWDEVKRLRTMPVPLLEKLKEYDFPKLYPENVDPAVMPAWPGSKFNYQIRIGCYLNGKLWGHFFMYYFGKQVPQGFLQLARHIADVFGHMLLDTRNKSMQKNSVFSWLTDILDGQSVEKESLDQIYWLLDWKLADTFILYRITSIKTGYDQSVIHWLNDNIGDISGIITFTYKDSVVVILREGDKQAQEVIDRISRLISITDHRCGISFPFSDLSKVTEYFKQAGYAIEHAPCTDLKMHAFCDCALEGLAEELKKSISWQEWITPALYRLIEIDVSQNTDYYLTLYYLLINNWHLGKTANMLYIHRNTLTYRLNKIEQLINIDLQNKSVWAYLMLCYKLLSEEYPVPAISQAMEEEQIQ